MGTSEISRFLSDKEWYRDMFKPTQVTLYRKEQKIHWGFALTRLTSANMIDKHNKQLNFEQFYHKNSWSFYIKHNLEYYKNIL